jgi:hypothetical protein
VPAVTVACANGGPVGVKFGDDHEALADKPFVLQAGDQFRPAPPPALTSARYTDDFNEVKSLGQDTSTARSAEQTDIGRFWGAAGPWIVLNQIGWAAATGFHNGLLANARMFALLDVSLADGVIALMTPSTPTTVGVRSPPCARPISTATPIRSPTRTGCHSPTPPPTRPTQGRMPR